MVRWHKIDYIGGDFTVARSPTMVESPLVRQYQLCLLNALGDFPVWPIDEETEYRLYDSLKIYYQKLAALIKPEPVDCDRLPWLVRHQFFICTEPVAHPKDGEMVVGLSHLSQLMGYAYSAEEFELHPQSTGTPELDLYIDTLLVFKGRAKQVLENFSSEDIGKMLVYASWRLTPEDDKEEGKLPKAKTLEPTKEAKDAQEFADNKEEITQRLRDRGVTLPENW